MKDQAPLRNFTLEEIYEAIVQSDFEWESRESTAINFGIVCGWHEGSSEIAERFNWSNHTLDYLSKMRAEFVKVCPAAADT